MTLIEALKKYDKVRRKDFYVKEFFIMLNKHGEMRTPNNKYAPDLRIEDLEASDWEEYKD